MITAKFVIVYQKATNTLQVLDTVSGRVFAAVPAEQKVSMVLQSALEYAMVEIEKTSSPAETTYWAALQNFCHTWLLKV